MQCKLQDEWRPSHFLPFIPLSSLENSQLLFWWRFILRNVTSVAFLLNRLYTWHLVSCSTFVIFWPKISDWLLTIDSLRPQLLLAELPLSPQQANFWTYPIEKDKRLCLILKPLWKTDGGRLEQINSYAATAAAKSLQLCPTLCDPRDSSPPGSPVPGILQARTLEWVAISFSDAWKWKVKVKSLSRVRLLATPWTAAHQAPPSIGFSKQEYWSGLPLPSLKFIWACHKTHWKLSWEERRGIWHQKTKRGPWCSYDSIKFDIMGIGERLSYLSLKSPTGLVQRRALSLLLIQRRWVTDVWCLRDTDAEMRNGSCFL